MQFRTNAKNLFVAFQRFIVQDFRDTLKKGTAHCKRWKVFFKLFLINLQLLSDWEKCDASKPGESCRRKVSVETSEKVRN